MEKRSLYTGLPLTAIALLLTAAAAAAPGALDAGFGTGGTVDSPVRRRLAAP